MNISNRFIALIAMISLLSGAQTFSMLNVDSTIQAQDSKKTNDEPTVLQACEAIAQKTGLKAAHDIVAKMKQFKSMLPKKLVTCEITKEPRVATCDELVACPNQLAKDQKVILDSDKNTQWVVAQDALFEKKDEHPDFTAHYRTIILAKAPTTFFGFVIKRECKVISRCELYYKGQGIISETNSRSDITLGFLPKACITLGAMAMAALVYSCSGSK